MEPATKLLQHGAVFASGRFDVLTLQRMAGNIAVEKLLRRPHCERNAPVAGS